MMDTLIKTHRLILRRPQLSDSEALASWISDPDVTRQTGTIPQLYTHLHAEFWIMTRPRLWREGKVYDYVITRGGDVIGSIGLFGGSVTTPFEIGYMLSKAHWGHGYMSEAVRALLDTAAHCLKTRSVVAHVYQDNPGSLAVMRKLGFTKTGEVSLWSMARGRSDLCDSFAWHSTDRVSNSRAVKEAS